MNAAVDCHEIEGVPGLFVDAFRGELLRKTRNGANTFILTHYHGDHYQSLPREFKYKGPAKIHCTPVTANLLIQVHQVPKEYVVAHEYTETWSFQKDSALPSQGSEADVGVTFYDANHCPGAAIVLVSLLDGTHHLHCGDMRYTPQMQSYQLLKEAAQQRKISLVYLDTTYGHPKHNFMEQSKAVNEIASTVEEIMKEPESTLVLLSCYSIGKEKVLLECAKRTNQPILVTDRKLAMLRCCQYSDLSFVTLDATKTNIHVVPMGLAGEIWPYFQPNYPKCRDYVEKLTHKQYSKVVAFLPTGWAHGSNWNQKNAIVSQSMPFLESDGHRITVEIRLVSYSEHSAFSELIDFVTFLRPRQVIPTVYGDANERRKIVHHFRNIVDNARAKKQFFASMKRPQPMIEADTKQNDTMKKVKAQKCDVDDKESSDNKSQLLAMGFSLQAVTVALARYPDNLQAALEELLSGNPGPPGSEKVGFSLKGRNSNEPIEVDVSSNSTPGTIARYFSPKQNKKR